jgi:glycerol-3-phosphate dehydrogenase (NAD(P)+)
MSKVIIIGAGAMGSAFAFPCLDRNHDTTIIGTHLEDKFIDELKSNNNFHSALKVNIPKSINISKFEKFDSILKSKTDLIVLAISSKGIEWIAEQVHSSVVIANKDIKVAKKISELLNTNYYHTSCSDDLIGVEVCAAIKNIFSMAVGASKGLCSSNATDEIKEKNYLNTASALIKQSIYEMEIFTKLLKGKKETVSGLAGLGDLYVSSAGGRNSKMGSYLGEGMTFSQAKNTKMKNVTVEGADLIFQIGKKIKEDFDSKQLPIMLAMIDAILEDKKLDFRWENFS